MSCREKFYKNKPDHTDGGFCKEQLCQQLPDPLRLLGPHIIPDNGNASGGHADNNRDHDLEEFHDNANHGHRNLRVAHLAENSILRTVFAQHIIDGSHCRDKGDLGKKTGHTQHQRSA